MAIKVSKATDIKTGSMSWMIYGGPGSGKTTFAATFPQPILMLNMVPAKEKMTVRGHPGLDVVDVDSPQDLNDALDYVLRNAANYKTILVDNLTTMLEILTRVKPRMNLEDWMPIGNQIMAMVDRLARLSCEVVYTAGLAAVPDEIGTGKHGGPALFRWLEQRLPHKMDALVFMESQADIRGVVSFRAHFSGSGAMKGRVRGVVPIGIMENPTYKKVAALLTDTLFKGKDTPAEVPQVQPDGPVVKASPESNPSIR